MVTPWLKSIAHITIWGIIKSSVTTAVILGGIGYGTWYLLVVKQWVADVEYEGNVDADKALEDLDDGAEDEGGKEEEKKEEGKGKGKGGKK
jgi:hypothetical protein